MCLLTFPDFGISTLPFLNLSLSLLFRSPYLSFYVSLPLSHSIPDPVYICLSEGFGEGRREG